MKYDVQLWQQVVAALQKSRGNNEFRGRQITQAARGIIFLEVEPRGEAAPAAAVLLQVGRTAADTFFVYGQARQTLAGFESAEAFVQAATQLARGRTPHIRTHLERTEYK
jgi:hypothetical protein